VVGTLMALSHMALELFLPDGLGPIRHRASAVHMGQPGNSFQNFKGFSNSIQTFKIPKCENGTSRAPKISKLKTVIDKFTWNTFPFWLNFQFSLYVEL
jgi:hypothetical protein